MIADPKIVVLPVVVGRNRGMFHVSRLTLDRDREPLVYVEDLLLGPFDAREAAWKCALSLRGAK